MFWKFVSVALLAVGVFGRTVFDPNSSYNPYDPYDTASSKFLDQYCNESVSSENLSQVKSSFGSFTQCIMGLFDHDTVLREFGEATIKNDYTEVFKKYCAKTPELKNCIQPLYTDLAFCLTAEQVSTEERVMNDLLEFTCGNNGAKLALFFKEDGAECIQEKLQFISSCIETTDVYDKATKGTRVNSVEMGCEDRNQILTCLVKGLKGCPNPIPGNFAEEFHEVVMKSHQCPKELKVEEVKTATVVTSNTKPDDLSKSDLLNSEFSKQLELLKKKKLELEVRTAEIEAWNRENELNIQHTVLTSDIKTNQPEIPATHQLE